MLKQLVCAALLMTVSARVSPAQQTAPSPPVTVIRAGKLVDVDADRMLTNQTLVIRGGKIEAVGENLSVPAGAMVIDLSKMTVLPRLIDCHTDLADVTDDEPLLVLQKTAAEGIKNAIRAGVTSIEHATLIDDEGIALAKEHGTYLDMDIYDEECIQDAAKENKTPTDFLEHDRDLGEIQRRNFTKAVRAGVKMSFGTDAGVCPHGINARQFAFMEKYGMTPMQAIQSATSSAADLLGKLNLLGSLQPGKYADIIAVSGNPLEDIRILENVKFVMKEGKIYKREP